MSPELEEKFAELASLPKGWRFGRGRGTDESVQERARSFAAVAEAMDDGEVSLFPGESGELLVCWGLYEFIFDPRKNSPVEVYYDLDPKFYQEMTDEDALLFLIFGPDTPDK